MEDENKKAIYEEFFEAYGQADYFAGGNNNLADLGDLKRLFTDWCQANGIEENLSVIPIHHSILNARIDSVKSWIEDGESIESIANRTSTDASKIEKYANLEEYPNDIQHFAADKPQQTSNQLKIIPTMTNYSLNLNLVKLPGAQYVKREDGRVCIAIPTSTLFVTEKGCYLNLAIWEQANQQYSSHLVKQSFSKEYYAKLTDEQRRAIPIIGNMKPMVASVTTTSATALETPPLTQTTQSTNDQPPIEQPPIEQPPIADDLPF